jgi:hypothetical protein
MLKVNKIIPSIVQLNRIMMVVAAYTFFLLKITCPIDVKLASRLVEYPLNLSRVHSGRLRHMAGRIRGVLWDANAQAWRSHICFNTCK